MERELLTGDRDWFPYWLSDRYRVPMSEVRAWPARDVIELRAFHGYRRAQEWLAEAEARGQAKAREAGGRWRR